MSEIQLDIFHNTTCQKGEDLQRCQFRAGKLNRRVLNFFKSHSYQNYTPFEVWKELGVNNSPKSSIQRSITDLTSMGYLVKLDGKEGRQFVQRSGQYKEMCFCWMLK